MLKKSIFILFAAVLVLSLAGSAAAKKPAPVTCELFWVDGMFNFAPLLVEGKMAYNETAQLYNVSCRYKFDFASGEWLDVATLCYLFPAYCNPSHTMFTFIGWGWSSEYGYTEDTTYQVHQNGQARFLAQLAPKQCDNQVMAMSYTYLPLEEWTLGTHSYYFIEVYADGSLYIHDPIAFTVDEKAPLLDSNVRLGLLGISSVDGGLETYVLNPEQETYIQTTWWSNLTEDLRFLHQNLVMQVVIDDGEPITIYPGPVVNKCSVDSDGAFEREWGYAR